MATKPNDVPYVIGGNNCSNYACSAIPSRFGKDIGIEDVNFVTSISTPNQTAKDLTDLAKINLSISAIKPHSNVSNLPTAKEMQSNKN